MAYPWFRAYSEMLHDPKIRRMTPAQRWVWVGLLCLASDSAERGTLELAPGIAYEYEDLALAVDAEQEDVERCLETATQMSMVRVDGSKLIIVNWDKRQYDNPSDAPERARARQRKHRESRRDDEPCHEQPTECVTSDVTSDVTSMSRDVTSMSRDVTTQIRLDTDTDSDTEAAAAPASAPQADPAVTAVIERWESVIAREASPADCSTLRGWLEEYGAERVNYAVGQCHIYGAPKLAYVWRVLADGGVPRASPDPPPKPKPSGPVVILNPLTGKREVIGGNGNTAGREPTSPG